MEHSQKKQQRIGEILVSEGKIDRSNLTKGLAEQKRRGERLGEVLVHLKILPEEEVAKGLALQLGVRYIDLNNTTINPHLLLLIPEPMVRKHLALPILMEGRYLLVAMNDPTDFDALSDLGFSCGMRITPALASRGALSRTIDLSYSLGGKGGGEGMVEVEEETQGEEEEEGGGDRGLLAPIVRLANWILARAVSARASDIHLEPAREEFRIRFRVDGMLQEEMHLPKWIQRPLLSRLKIMARLDISERRRPQDGAVRLRVSGRELDLRVAILPTQFGEKAVLRLLDPVSSVVGLNQIGLSEADLSTLLQLLRRPYGMVLVTGPTGSGKTTTLYGMIQELRSVSRNIVTVEDPIEYTIEEVNQTEVNTEIGLTFATCLRALLRQDPNVILIGEIRDSETAEIACRAALTGHLVLSTLHTNDAPSAFTRMIDLGVPPYLVASVVIGILAQRLVRRLCSFCVREEGGTIPVFHGVGCERCDQKGFLGRAGLFEFLLTNPPLVEQIMAGLPNRMLRDTAISYGMVPLREDGLKKVRMGTTSMEEVLRVAEGEEGIESHCPGCGFSIQSDFLHCPSCGGTVPNHCSGCKRSVRPDWGFCPYCRTKTGSAREKV